MNVVAARVDALVLAYRVELEPLLVQYLEHQMKEAAKHGAASMRWRSIVGRLSFSRTSKVWHVENVRYALHIQALSEELEDGTKRAGWTVEIKWHAHELANMPHTGPACEEGKRIAGELGEVLEQRVRRFDLCADVAGWRPEAKDVERLVRRSRAKVDTHGALAPVQVDGQMRSRTKTHHNHAGVTGITVCPGGVVMNRIYDKREELAVRGVEEKTVAEEARWRAGGWDGAECVTRVEFQIRGEAVKELGLRNPFGPIHPRTGVQIARALHERIDAVWQRLLQWLKLVELTGKRRSECPLDPVWVALKTVRFFKQSIAALRFRIRRHASPEQTFGCALSMVGARVGLEDVRPGRATLQVNPAKVLLEHVTSVMSRAGALIAEDLTRKWKGPAKALEHAWTVHDAKRAYYNDRPIELELAKTASA